MTPDRKMNKTEECFEFDNVSPIICPNSITFEVQILLTAEEKTRGLSVGPSGLSGFRYPFRYYEVCFYLKLIRTFSYYEILISYLLFNSAKMKFYTRF